MPGDRKYSVINQHYGYGIQSQDTEDKPASE